MVIYQGLHQSKNFVKTFVAALVCTGVLCCTATHAAVNSKVRVQAPQEPEVVQGGKERAIEALEMEEQEDQNTQKSEESDQVEKEENNTQAIAAPYAEPEIKPTQHYAGIKFINGAIRFYFVPDKVFVADGAKAALGNTALAAKRGSYVVISGYVDPTKDAQSNEKIAEQRALNIRKVLIALGAPEKQIILLKPQAAQTEGQNFMALCVDVKVEGKNAYAPELMFTIRPEGKPTK